MLLHGRAVAEAHLFWWYYKSTHRVTTPTKPWPTVLWLQGGPVRSSLFFLNLTPTFLASLKELAHAQQISLPFFSFSGSVRRRAWQLPGGRAARRQPETTQLDVAAEGRPHLRGQEIKTSLRFALSFSGFLV
jgi:hypothetical protein